jgi:hypothetical protein
MLVILNDLGGFPLMSAAENAVVKRSRHGLHALTRRVSAKGLRSVDGRTTAMRAVAAWKADLIADLGGDPSAQKLTLIDAATKTMLYLNHVDSWLMQQSTLVNKRKRAILPILRERQGLVDSLSRLLQQVGLERQATPVKPLAQYIAEKEKAE